MALPEAFLADLDELSDEEDDEQQQQLHEQEGGEDGEAMDAEGDEGAAAAGAPDNHNAYAGEVGRLAETAHYQSVMSRVRARLPHDEGEEAAAGGAAATNGSGAGATASQQANDDALVLECNRLALDMDAEAASVHAQLRELMRARFPELETLVHAPLDYAKVCERLLRADEEQGAAAAGGNGDGGGDGSGGNTNTGADVAQLALDDLLPAAAVMVVAVTATTTAGRALPPRQLERALGAAGALRRVFADRRDLERFVGARMGRAAPNLAALVGSAVAARLVGAAGGLQALARMPACNIQVLGARKRGSGALATGLSSANSRPAQSCALAECPIVAGAPPGLRTRAVRVIAAKCALLARVDAHHAAAAAPAAVVVGGGAGAGAAAGGSNGGGDGGPSAAAAAAAARAGAAARDDVLRKLAKWQEPPPARIVKPLAVPDAGEKKARRGGRRLRRLKERYGQTSLREAANRTAFDFARGEEEYLDGDEVVGLGTLGSREGAGRLRVVARAQKVKLSAKQQKKLQQQQQRGAGGGVSGFATGMATALGAGGGMGVGMGGGGAGVGGMVSSLTFTPAQGIELVDPARVAQQQQQQQQGGAAGGGGGGAAAGPSSRIGELGRLAGGTESYFSEAAGFKSVVPRGL